MSSPLKHNLLVSFAPSKFLTPPLRRAPPLRVRVCRAAGARPRGLLFKRPLPHLCARAHGRARGRGPLAPARFPPRGASVRVFSAAPLGARGRGASRARILLLIIVGQFSGRGPPSAAPSQQFWALRARQSARYAVASRQLPTLFARSCRFHGAVRLYSLQQGAVLAVLIATLLGSRGVLACTVERVPTWPRSSNAVGSSRNRTRWSTPACGVRP